MPQLLQLTDLHLFADRSATLKGVVTWENWLRMRDHLVEGGDRFDLIVVTGDIAHDETRETYVSFRESLPDEWRNRLRLLPGNHDHRGFMREVFPESAVPVSDDPDRPLHFDERVGPVRVIGLDTHVFGEVPGFLDPGETDWLAERLSDGDKSPIILFQHHPPASVNSPWMDEIALQNPERLLSLIAEHERIGHLFTGHVHHHFQGRIGSMIFESTPAVAMQFTPGAESLSIDPIPAGYRTITIEPDMLTTRVHRLPE